MRLFKGITINKKKRKINLRRTSAKKRRSRRRTIINLYESNRRTAILNQIKTNSLRRLFVKNVKISNIIKNLANVYNIKKTIKFANKTLIKKNQDLMLIVDALNLIFIERRIRALILKDKIFTQRDKHEIIILININNEKIFML